MMGLILAFALEFKVEVTSMGSIICLFCYANMLHVPVEARRGTSNFEAFSFFCCQALSLIMVPPVTTAPAQCSTYYLM